MTVSEQIDTMPLNFLLKSRIKELTSRAGNFQMESTEKFKLMAAFSWCETSEGGEYWYELDLTLLKGGFYGDIAELLK
jgi:phage tail tube protein FII